MLPVVYCEHILTLFSHKVLLVLFVFWLVFRHNSVLFPSLYLFVRMCDRLLLYLFTNRSTGLEIILL